MIASQSKKDEKRPMRRTESQPNQQQPVVKKPVKGNAEVKKMAKYTSILPKNSSNKRIMNTESEVPLAQGKYQSGMVASPVNGTQDVSSQN